MSDQDPRDPFGPSEGRIAAIERRLGRVERGYKEMQRYLPYVEKVLDRITDVHQSLGVLNEGVQDINGRLLQVEHTVEETQRLIRNGNGHGE